MPANHARSTSKNKTKKLQIFQLSVHLHLIIKLDIPKRKNNIAAFTTQDFNNAYNIFVRYGWISSMIIRWIIKQAWKQANKKSFLYVFFKLLATAEHFNLPSIFTKTKKSAVYRIFLSLALNYSRFYYLCRFLSKILIYCLEKICSILTVHCNESYKISI